jgi:hypothetical protein
LREAFLSKQRKCLSAGDKVPDALEEALRLIAVRAITTAGTGILVEVLIRARTITRGCGGCRGRIISGGCGG